MMLFLILVCIWFRSEFLFHAKYARIGFKLVEDYSANGEIRNTFPTILDIIDISHDRFKREEWRKKDVYLVCKEQSVIQKNHPERSIIQKFSGKTLNR